MLAAVSNVYVFVGILVAIAAVVAIVLLWWRQRRAAKAAGGGAAPPPSGAAGSQPIDALFKEASTRLRLSPRMKGASLRSLPAFLVVGPEKSGKTSVVARSGLDPELLAGQVYQGSETVPTAALNVWLARQALIVEISAALAADPLALRAILKHLVPGRLFAAFRKARPARAILLCMNQAPLAAAATMEEISAAARPWNQCLTDVANTLGVQLPVYVLFTRLDAMAGFPEFVSNLGAKEPEQAVGATVRPFNPAGRGAYAEETARVVNSHLSQVVYSLADSRVPLLIREKDRVQAALQYQFPRDFQRLQKNLVQFLVEVAKPSQLRVSPFLRGFYFSGIRKVVVDQPAGPDQPGLRESMGAEAVVATTVFSPEQMRGPMAPAPPQRPAAPRESVEWLFVRGLFEGVLFRDRSAHGVSAATSRGEQARALIFGLAAFLGLLLLTAFTVSYVRNRSLERELRDDGTALKDPRDSRTVLARLEQMRPPVDRLIAYRAGRAPFFMRWGLYSGDDLMPWAQDLYCSQMRNRVFQPVMSQMAGHLQVLGKSGGDPDADFAVLKAYMMVTTHPEKADAGMADVLFNSWKETPGAAVNIEGDQLLPAEFRTYLALLPIRDSQGACVNVPFGNLIETAQQYFRGLQYDDHYQNLLAQAGAGVDPIDYNKTFPNAAVADAEIVKGCFTSRGWERMQRILSQPPEEWQSNDWVLGNSKEVTPAEIATYRERYAGDYKKAWVTYLTNAKVAPYRNIEDAKAKLEQMSNQRSFLLSLLGLASENTAVNEEMRSAFQPVRAVAPDSKTFDPAKDYLKALTMLANRLDTAAGAGPAHDQAAGTIREAETNVRDSVSAISLLPGFKGEADESVKRILLDPLLSINPLLARQDSDAVNGAASELCASYGALANLYPFSETARRQASPEDVDAVYQPDRGKMWQLYNNFLGDSLDCSAAGCRLKGNPRYPLQLSFVEFFSRLCKLSRLLYSPQIQVTVERYNSVRQLDFSIDATHVTVPAGSSGAIPWSLHNPRPLKVTGDFEGVDPGEILFESREPWALFQWLYGDSIPESRRSGVFHWIPRFGQRTPATLKNGRTKEYQIEIKAGDPPSPLDLQSLQLGPCRAPLAR